ncbi:MAG TPA: hypothetical protein VLT90_13095 [Terriglobales bacterium]|nr:hypothetical protein [Terriglobales bacterium]
MSAILGDDELGYRPGHVNRTWNGRPYVLVNPDWPEPVVQMDGFTDKPGEPRGKSAIYTRVTTFISCLEDTYALGEWQNRMVALGMAVRPQLVAQAQRVDLDAPQDQVKEQLNEVAYAAKDAANWKLKADLGTDFHEITREYDGGRRDWRNLSDTSRSMLAAYATATKGCTFEFIEARLVNDTLKYLGTTDRLGWVECSECVPGKSVTRLNALRVYDLKTGRIDFGQSKMALQLAAYSLSKLYDPDTGIRTDLPICPHVAYIIHAPYGEGTCAIYPVPLAPALEALTELVPRVRAFRAKMNWFDAPLLSGGQATSGVAAAWSVEPPESL